MKIGTCRRQGDPAKDAAHLGRTVTDADPLRSDLATSSEYVPAQYALSAVVYAERGDEILLLQRAEGSAMAGQWFLPGALVEPGELPEEGARRELFEEGGVQIEGATTTLPSRDCAPDDG